MVDTVAINDKFALNMKMGPTFQTTVQKLSAFALGVMWSTT